ncbi:hypothetical protein ACFQ08_05520 [Streptosporangium algeriense]|uniref:Uncharacterized protein n=1 Tax=Streptosporangium algeriense TaxID=1682748 RepID=A0ABW3DJH8_9ACTN
MTREVRLTAEWALWGKPSHTRDDYNILECSRGKFDHDDFGKIITRYSPGTPTDLPQVTVSWVGGIETPYLGLAIQEWSDRRDRLGRPIADTRYFCVPYGQIADGPVSYEGLYDAFDGHALPVDGPLGVNVPVLDREAIADRADRTAMSAAALLLTDEQVCVVRGEATTMRERLRFLDTVAALLPYGLRARLTVSTWTDSSAEHRIKLSFAKHTRDGAYSVTWGADDGVAARRDIAGRYLELLQALSAEEVVTRLAEQTEPLSFRDAQHRAPALLDDYGRTTALMPARWSSTQVGDFLNACGDCLERERYEELGGLLAKLNPVAARLTDDERRRYREIIRVERLLGEHPKLSRSLETHLYDTALAIGYGPVLTAGAVERITEDTGGLRRPLVNAMLRMTVEFDALVMLLPLCSDNERKMDILRTLQTGDLVRVAAREPFDPPIVQLVYRELVIRGGDSAEDPAIAPALRKHDYLAAAIGAVHPDDGEIRFAWFKSLLVAAYGRSFGRAELAEVLRFPLPPESAGLVAAAVDLYGSGARNVVMSAFCEFLEQARLTPKTLNHVVGHLLPPPVPDPQPLNPQPLNRQPLNPQPAGPQSVRPLDGLNPAPSPRPHPRPRRGLLARFQSLGREREDDSRRRDRMIPTVGWVLIASVLLMVAVALVFLFTGL